jgi:hypothetical protein
MKKIVCSICFIIIAISIYAQKMTIDEYEPISERITNLLTQGLECRILVILNTKIDITKFYENNEDLKTTNIPKKDASYPLLEQYLLTKFGNFEKFSLVTRHVNDELMQEVEIGLTGVLDEKTKLKIGSQLGANYIIKVDTRIAYYSYDSLDASSVAKLINLEKMRIEAVSTKEIDMRSDTEYHSTVNGESVDYDPTTQKFYINY